MNQSLIVQTFWATYRPVLLITFVIACLVAVYLQPEWHEFLQYQQASFSAQIWQGISHAFVHLNQQHLALNALALFCIYLLFPSAFISGLWILVFCGSAFISSLGLYWFSPDVEWCMGASGALHGLMVYTMLRAKANVIWLLAVLGKIAFEQLDLFATYDLPNLTSDFIKHTIVVDAHLWGAIGGLIFFCIAQSINFVRIVKEVNTER